MSTVNATTGAQTAPTFIQPNFDRMPPELKVLNNWVLWAPVWNGTKYTKRPIQISGYGASTTKRKHWTSFDAAKQAYERAATQGFMELRQKDICGSHRDLLSGREGRYYFGEYS